MKGQTLRYIIAVLSLLLCSVSCLAQEKTREERATALLNDAESIPSDFARLGQQLNFKHWNSACSADGVEIARHSLEAYVIALKEADYMAGTVRVGKGWSLPQVAQVSYVFSVGVPLVMVLSKTAHCTEQKELSDDFILLGLRLVDSTDNAHKFEMVLIQDEEDIIDILTPKKQEAPPVMDHATI
jgi:hypothetical protein